MITLAPREGSDSRRVGSTGWLGYAEGLQAKLSRCDLGEEVLLLLDAAMTKQSTHGVHLRVARAAISPRTMNFFKHRRGGSEPQSRATVLLRNQYR